MLTIRLRGYRVHRRAGATDDSHVAELAGVCGVVAGVEKNL